MRRRDGRGGRVPVTVKCRIGVDERSRSRRSLLLSTAVKAAGVGGVIVHARKAWLEGFSPKDNRSFPRSTTHSSRR